MALCALPQIRLSGAENPKAYAIISIKNAMRDFLKYIRYTEPLQEVSVDRVDDLEERIEALQLNERQEIVLRLRLEGYNDREIATKTNCSRETINKIRAQIRAVYLRRN